MLFALMFACGTQAEIVENATIKVHPDPGVTCYVYHGTISCIADPWVDIVVQSEEDTAVEPSGLPVCPPTTSVN
jgi:hypothetical protein